MKINNIDGEIVKDNDTYLLKDNTELENISNKFINASSWIIHKGAQSSRTGGSVSDN